MDRGMMTSSCPECGHPVTIDLCWTPGGINDYGGFILKCEECDTVWDIYIGRDVNDSSVRSGARLLDRWDKGIEGDKERALSKHGLP